MIALVLTVGLPHAAQALTTPNNVRVNAVNAQVFEAIAPVDQADYYWCGASHFARRSLGAAWSDKIHIVRGRGASATTNRKTAVQFSLGEAPSPLSAGERTQFGDLLPGHSLTVTQANGFCSLRLLRD